MEQLDDLVRDIQADAKRIRLLNILGRQLELFITGGQPDLDNLLISLKAEALVSDDEYCELESTFALDKVSSLTSREVNV